MDSSLAPGEAFFPAGDLDAPVAVHQIGLGWRERAACIADINQPVGTRKLKEQALLDFSGWAAGNLLAAGVIGRIAHA